MSIRTFWHRNSGKPCPKFWAFSSEGDIWFGAVKTTPRRQLKTRQYGPETYPVKINDGYVEGPEVENEDALRSLVAAIGKASNGSTNIIVSTPYMTSKPSETEIIRLGFQLGLKLQKVSWICAVPDPKTPKKFDTDWTW